MTDYKKIALEAICSVNQEMLADVDKNELYAMFETPANSSMGDLALACFKLSKTLRKAPPMIANELVSNLNVESNEWFVKIEAVSGYINFFINRDRYISEVLKGISDAGANYGSEDIGMGRTVCFDYSSPNIAKPFHVGHLFTTVIGNSLYRIYKFMGFNTIGINHLGDWGTQFGKLIVAYKKWGDREAVVSGKVKELVRLYVKFHEEAEKDESLNDEARAWFTKLEEKNEEALELWSWFVELSLEEFKKTYKMLDIEFDSYNGEAFYNDKMQPIIDELKEKNMLKESDGAQIVDLEEYDMPPCLILKKDGSSLYATRDIAAGFYRKQEYDFYKCFYVMGGSQSLHFKQWTKVVELMGYDWVKDCEHVPFGMVSINGQMLATRTGNVILLDDLFNDAINQTLQVIEQKNPNLPNKEEVARQIGVGAIVFGYLFSNRNKDISFNIEQALNFDGETGPYVQYTHARTCSLISKSDLSEADYKDVDYSKLTTDEEYALVKALAQFNEKIRAAMDASEPSIITRYIVDVAQCFNKFYHDCSILVDDVEMKKARLALVNCTRIVLKNGLYLIGLNAPEKV